MIRVLILVIVVTSPALLVAQRRARPPQDQDATFGGIFFERVTRHVAEDRPRADQLGQRAAPVSVEARRSEPEETLESGSGWQRLVSPVSLEDEVKRIKLHLDGVITSPGAFRSGGYADARLDLSILSMLFAVIADYQGEVRWKNDAPAARDLLARTARNASSGATQVYNEAKLRQQDLQDLLRGAGLDGRQAEPENDWSVLVDRSPLMKYLELIYQGEISSLTASDQEFADSLGDIKRYSEMVAVAAEVLTREGMPEADDSDYAKLATAMQQAALELRAAVEREDAEGARTAAGAIGQTCAACHEIYR